MTHGNSMRARKVPPWRREWRFLRQPRCHHGGTLRMQPSLQDIDRISVRFDDDNAVASAGLLVAATLLARLGLEKTTDVAVSRGFRPGRKLVTLVNPG